MEGIYLKICRQFSELTSGAAVDLCVELVTCWVFGRKCTEDGRIHLRAIGIKSPGSATLEGGGHTRVGSVVARRLYQVNPKKR